MDDLPLGVISSLGYQEFATCHLVDRLTIREMLDTDPELLKIQIAKEPNDDRPLVYLPGTSILRRPRPRSLCKALFLYAATKTRP